MPQDSLVLVAVILCNRVTRSSGDQGRLSSIFVSDVELSDNFTGALAAAHFL